MTTAGVLTETTVAAPQTPFLRASVNAVPGAGKPVSEAAKVGNATLFRKSAASKTILTGGWENRASPPPGGAQDTFALHVDGGK